LTIDIKVPDEAKLDESVVEGTFVDLCADMLDIAQCWLLLF